MENHNKPSLCPHCGNLIPTDSPGGHCPRCLLAGAGMTTQPSVGPGAPFEAPSIEQVAAALPHLEILELIGQGGMGCVFKARQPKLDRLVALKVLPPGFAMDPAFAVRFEREARALAALNHPNIVTIHDFGQSGGFYYLLMEFVDGVNLRQLLRSRKLAPKEALAIIPPLCEALQFAHDRGIVHRDIKPENLLLDKNGRIKVADFGIAKMLGGGPATEGESIAGTPRYMAPEQKFSSPDADHRCDIYSLGVVLYEMLTGELPVGKFEAPSRKVQIDVRLDEIVLQALEKTPQMRFQTATDFRTKVETVMRDEADSPNEPEPFFRRLLGKCSCYVSDKQSLATFVGQFFHFRQVADLILDERFLTVTGPGPARQIPLSAIQDVSLGHYPIMMNPAGLDLISLSYTEKGEVRQVFIAPFQGGLFALPRSFNRFVNDWFMMIREAVEKSTGRQIETTPSQNLGIPPSSPWLYLALALPLAIGLLMPGFYLFWLAGVLFFAVIFLGGIGLALWFQFRNRIPGKGFLSPGRRLACGLVGFLVPIVPMLVYSNGNSQKSKSEIGYQTSHRSLVQKEGGYFRDLELANQKMAMALVDARNARDSKNLNGLKELARDIEKLTGQQQAARLDTDRIFQQKTFLERNQPHVSQALGWGTAVIACTLLVTLYLLSQATIPLLIPSCTLLIALAVAFGTLRMNQSEQDINHNQIDQITQKSVGDLPGEPGRYGPTLGTWNSIISAAHAPSAYSASISFQPRCGMVVRTFVKKEGTITEIPEAAFWAAQGQPDQATSVPFRWEPRVNSSGQMVLGLSGFGEKEIQLEIPVPGIPRELVWNAANPDPMNLTSNDPDLQETLYFPLRMNQGQYSARNFLRFPILIGQAPGSSLPPTEILVEWGIFPLEKTVADLIVPIRKMGKDAAKVLRIPDNRVDNTPVSDAIPNNQVSVLKGSGSPQSSRITWKVTGASQRLVKIRCGDRLLSRWMTRDPDNGPFGLTFSAEMMARDGNRPGPRESVIQWTLEKGMESEILENWAFPGVPLWANPKPSDPNPGQIWLHQPLVLLENPINPVILELSDHEDPTQTKKNAKEIPVLEKVFARMTWQDHMFLARQTLNGYLKKENSVELVLFRKGKNRATSTLPELSDFSKDPTPTALALVASATQEPEEILGEVPSTDTWRKQQKSPSYFHVTFDPPIQIRSKLVDPGKDYLTIKELLIPLPEERLTNEILVCDNEKVRGFKGFNTKLLGVLVVPEEFQLRNVGPYRDQIRSSSTKEK